VKAKALFFFIVTITSGLIGLWLRSRLRPAPLADVSIPSGGTVVPLEIDGRHLFVKAIVSTASKRQTPGLFLLDNGAADLFISEAKARALGLSLPATVRPQSHETIYVPHVSFQVGTAKIADYRSVVLSEAEQGRLSQYFGHPVDGILGYELFQQLVVEVDPAKHQLSLFLPQTYRDQGPGDRFAIQIKDRRPYLEATVLPYGNPSLPATLLVDLGSNGALSIAAGCGTDRKLTTTAPKLLRRQLTTIRGEQQISMGRVQALKLGPQFIQQPLTVFSTDAEACDRLSGKIGSQILQQFRLVFNYPQRQLRLTPQNDLSRPSQYEYDLSGLWIQAQDRGSTYRIETVFPETPAAAAGLQSGDILHQINHRPVEQMSLSQIRQQLSRPGQTVLVQTQRGRVLKQSALHLQPLL
jgi:PDZ domain